MPHRKYSQPQRKLKKKNFAELVLRTFESYVYLYGVRDICSHLI